MRLLSMLVISLGLCACSFTAPIGPRDRGAEDAEVVARDPAALDPSATEANECINSCRVKADEDYNLCRAQTPGNESACALARDKAYTDCPGGCG